jgi:sortase A
LSIPRVDASLIVLAGASGRTLAFGPGHTAGTSPPGGEGTAIINGHRDTHFSVLRTLEPGDALDLERPDGRRVRYRVTRMDVVDSRDTRLLAPADRPALLLVTCWPFESLIAGGPLRYVVTADRDPNELPFAGVRRPGEARVIGSPHDAARAEVLGVGLRGRGAG